MHEEELRTLVGTHGKNTLSRLHGERGGLENLWRQGCTITVSRSPGLSQALRLQISENLCMQGLLHNEGGSPDGGATPTYDGHPRLSSSAYDIPADD